MAPGSKVKPERELVHQVHGFRDMTLRKPAVTVNLGVLAVGCAICVRDVVFLLKRQ